MAVQLKGCPSSEIPSLVEDMAKEIGLQLKRKAYSKTLSGGQKRKLCVGIALIGGSKVRNSSEQILRTLSGHC